MSDLLKDGFMAALGCALLVAVIAFGFWAFAAGVYLLSQAIA